MINYKLFKNNGLTIKSIRKINSAYLINDGKNNFVIKDNNCNLKDKFDYLYSRSFNSFPVYYKIDNYDVFSYINDSNISSEERLYEMINLIILLHTKTTRYKNIDIDDYKIIYEDLLKKIEYLYNYYIALNDSIDSEIYMSPSHYLLARNISKIYGSLSFCKNELDNWYEIIKSNNKQRVVFIHNNLDLEHVLVNKNSYLISWNNSKVDLPIYDLVGIYNKYHDKIDFSVLLNHYLEKYPLTIDEMKLFFIIISVPFKIEFSNDEIKNIQIVRKLINKISSGDRLIKPYYLKNKKK
ncbi:MAG: hypothetical protein IJL74_03215 [Bacilli bacterium]|nr:hypothetical protein [Bacilli bacterium]